MNPLSFSDLFLLLLCLAPIALICYGKWTDSKPVKRQRTGEVIDLEAWKRFRGGAA